MQGFRSCALASVTRHPSKYVFGWLWVRDPLKWSTSLFFSGTLLPLRFGCGSSGFGVLFIFDEVVGFSTLLVAFMLLFVENSRMTHGNSLVATTVCCETKTRARHLTALQLGVHVGYPA